MKLFDAVDQSVPQWATPCISHAVGASGLAATTRSAVTTNASGEAIHAGFSGSAAQRWQSQKRLLEPQGAANPRVSHAPTALSAQFLLSGSQRSIAERKHSLARRCSPDIV
jgi:hypothetical protein